jgi:hypothetical protein
MAKREREQAKREKRERKRLRRAAAAENKAAQPVEPDGESADGAPVIDEEPDSP